MIKIWNPATYPDSINQIININIEFIENYWKYEKYLDELDSDRNIESIGIRIEGNKYYHPYFDAIHKISEALVGEMVFAYHYTRMVDEEVDDLRRYGFQLSTVDFLSERTQRLVVLGIISESEREHILIQSPLLHTGFGKRNDQIWFATDPFRLDSSNVNLLVGHWGGESAYWCVRGELLEKLQEIGQPRVIEVQLECGKEVDSQKRSSLARVICDRYAAQCGLVNFYSGVDICVRVTIPAKNIIGVISPDEKEFLGFGVSYPDDIEQYLRFR